jgi:hypothetical protein
MRQYGLAGGCVGGRLHSSKQFDRYTQYPLLSSDDLTR